MLLSRRSRPNFKFFCGCVANDKYVKVESASPKNSELFVHRRTLLLASSCTKFNFRNQERWRAIGCWKHDLSLECISAKWMRKPYLLNLSICRCIHDGSRSQEKNQTAKWFTIPNILTISRMAVSPYIAYLVICDEFHWALGLFVVAAISDSVDGLVARKFNDQNSILGSYIDPLADKVMVSSVTISLTAINIIPAPLCGLILLRDVLIATAAVHFHFKNLSQPRTVASFFDFENSKVRMEPTPISKCNTFLQLGLVALSITAPVLGFLDHPLLQAYWYAVASSTILSGLSYVLKDKSAYQVK